MNKKERKTFEKENKKKTQYKYIISSLWAYGCINMSNKQQQKRFNRKCLDYCFSVKRQIYFVCIALIIFTKQFFPSYYTITYEDRSTVKLRAVDRSIIQLFYLCGGATN